MGAQLELAVMKENPRYWLYVTITGKMVEFLNLSQLQHASFRPLQSQCTLDSILHDLPKDTVGFEAIQIFLFFSSIEHLSLPFLPVLQYAHLTNKLRNFFSLQIEFGTSLDLAPYMTDRRSPPVNYELYGVLVHQGFSVHSGHYFAYVKAPNGLWYQMNDEHVSQVIPFPHLLIMLLGV